MRVSPISTGRSVVAWAMSKVEHLMFDSSMHHPIQLALYRIGFATWLIVSNQLPTLRWIAGVPADFRSPPPGLSTILPHPTSAMAVTIEVLTLAYLICLLVGWRTRFSSVALGVLGLIGSAMVFSFGKIDHNIFLWIIPLAMSTSAWGERISIDSRSTRARNEPVSTPAIPFLAILLALAFATAALPKLFGGWLATNASATQSYFLDKVLRDETNLSTTFFESIDQPAFWEFADWSTIVLEFGFAALILSPFAYRLLVNVAVVFHITVLFVLNINFESSLVLYLVFAIQLIDVDRIDARLERLRNHRTPLIIAGMLFIAAAVAAQLFGPGLLRASFGLIGVGEWGVTLVTQLFFFAVIVRLTVRSLPWTMPFSRSSAANSTASTASSDMLSRPHEPWRDAPASEAELLLVPTLPRREFPPRQEDQPVELEQDRPAV